MAADLLPVIRVARGTVTPYVITVGDPERAASIAGRLEGSKEVGSFREYVSYQGTYEGVPLTVTSHGVGGAGAAVAFEELIQGGARTIIRLGTCGAFLPHIRSGDLVIATGAAREDGVSAQLLPLSYPALSDIDVTRALIDAATAADGVKYAVGVMLTKAAFYPGALPDHARSGRQSPVLSASRWSWPRSSSWRRCEACALVAHSPWTETQRRRRNRSTTTTRIGRWSMRASSEW